MKKILMSLLLAVFVVFSLGAETPFSEEKNSAAVPVDPIKRLLRLASGCCRSVVNELEREKKEVEGTDIPENATQPTYDAKKWLATRLEQVKMFVFAGEFWVGGIAEDISTEDTSTEDANKILFILYSLGAGSIMSNDEATAQMVGDDFLQQLLRDRFEKTQAMLTNMIKVEKSDDSVEVRKEKAEQLFKQMKVIFHGKKSPEKAQEYEEPEDKEDDIQEQA